MNTEQSLLDKDTVMEARTSDQLIRQWRLIRLLMVSPNGLTVAELAKHLDTKPRTVYRDFTTMQRAGFIVKRWNEGRTVLYSMDKDYLQRRRRSRKRSE